MDITLDAEFAAVAFTEKLVAAGLTKDRLIGVSESPKSGQTIVHLTKDATDEDIALVATVAGSFDRAGVLRAEQEEVLRVTCRDYIYSHYDEPRQASLNALLTESVLTGLTNRATYVGLALTWIKSVLAYYYDRKDALAAATTVEEVKAVTWDFPGQLDASDPAITLRQALTMSD